MDDEAAKKAAELFRRIHGEVSDDLDEEMELELDDDRIADTIEGVLDHPAAETEERKLLFRASCSGCSASSSSFRTGSRTRS